MKWSLNYWSYHNHLEKNVDLEDICHTLRKQIQFIDILQNVKLIENKARYDTNNAHLLPRKNASLKYNDLLEFIEKQKNNKQSIETSKSWKQASLVLKSMNDYYLLE